MLTIIAAICALLVFLFYIWIICKLGNDLAKDEEQREIDRRRQELDAGTNDNRCACCGEVIPEGTQVCKKCSTE